MSTYLSYHEVSGEASPYLYSVPASVFAEHVAVAVAHGAVVTFDDGHVSQHRYGLEALQRNGTKAIFFCTAGWVERDPDAMNWAQLRELASLGHTIAAHGWSHKFLTRCSDEELVRELRHARLHLEDGVGHAVDAVSLPNGRWNRRVLDACGTYGYRRVFGSYPWFPSEVGTRTGGIEAIGRMNVPNRMSAGALDAALRAGPARQWLPRLKHTAIRATRSVLGDETYQQLWCWLARRDPEAESRRGKPIF